MIVDLLPLILWIGSLLWAGAVCVLCVIRGRLLSRERHPDVELVSWNVIYAQVCSVVLCAVPFMVLILLQDDLDSRMLAWYDQYQIIGAIISIVMIIIEWLLMFVQSKRAEHTQIDRVLRRKRG